ncbi:hypothetical protein RQN30_06810 [Arcanobacterium hippocoleae]
MPNSLFTLAVILLTALLFAPPITLTYLDEIRTRFWETRFGQLFLPKPERDSIEQVTILDLMAAALNTGMAIPAALRAVEVSLGSPHRNRKNKHDSGYGRNKLGYNVQNKSQPNIRISRIQNLPTQAARVRKNRVPSRDLNQVAASLLMGASWSEAWEGVSKRI